MRRQKRLPTRQRLERPHARHVRLPPPVHATALVIQAKHDVPVSVLFGNRAAARFPPPEATVLRWPHEGGIAEERQAIAGAPEGFHHGLYPPESGLILIPVGADDEIACPIDKREWMVKGGAARQRQPEHSVMAQAGTIEGNAGRVRREDEVGQLRLWEEGLEGIGVLDRPPCVPGGRSR